MALNSKTSRAPKQLGDFGEGLVNYVLNRKGHEVAKVDHVGADLISECLKKRYAISVKTRSFKKGTRESLSCTISFDSIEKLKFFSDQFGLIPLFSQVICLQDSNQIMVFILPINNIDKFFKKAQNGYILNFGKKHVDTLKNSTYIDFSCWENESIGNSLFDI